MPGRIDIGGYFEKLTRQGRGGRRSEELPERPEPDEPADEPDDGGSKGGFGSALKDLARRGGAAARTTAGKVRRRSSKGRGAFDDLPSEGVVVIDYSPRLDGDPDPGEVVWTWVPYEDDPSQGKDRPVVIIGRRGASLVGVPLTTKPNGNEAQLKLGTGGWDPKRRTSYARIWRMLDVDPDRTRREGAVLDAPRFEALVKMVDRYYDVHVPPDAVADDEYDY